MTSAQLLKKFITKQPRHLNHQTPFQGDRFGHSYRTMAAWQRLIRFVDDNGKETFGEPLVSSESELESKLASNELYATEFKGKSPVGDLARGEKVHVKSLRGILKPSDVPIIRCIGLNYTKHSKSALEPDHDGN